ncbi:MAG TPA: hypothetical protein VM165_05785, partial [Planctomycetaceae bacterium]|nr:hypothetical protein [Planctomycetaceae bacterium]
LFPVVVPFLLNIPERFGLSFRGWDLVLFVFAGTYLAAAACWILLNPNGTIFDTPATSETRPASLRGRV